MKITDVINADKPSLSFEVFPPKNETAFESVKTATEEIAKLNPSYMSVTYGAGGQGGRYTLSVVENLKKQGVIALEHLTCVGATKDSIKERINEIKSAGIKNVMALRGDIPDHMKNSDINGWDYRYAADLVRELKSLGDFCVGGACYPEIHPESLNQKEDIKYLKEKVDAGCDFLTTQMFFDNNLFYNFLYKIREAGITVPVVAGIMPITAANQLERAIKLSGSFVPQRFKSLVDRFGENPAAMMQAGIAYATDQIIDLFANGINAVHVYSMNKPVVAQKIQSNLSEILDLCTK
jgi:methylenetetrahydrofolate reductase (NADPH)